MGGEAGGERQWLSSVSLLGRPYPAAPRLVSSPGKHGMGISLGKRWYLGAAEPNRPRMNPSTTPFCDLL